MKKLLSIVSMVLALNFLGVGGVAGWLVASKHLDKARLAAVKAILFPPPPAPATQPAAQADAAPQPSARLESLLAQANGKPANEQVELIQRTFDQQTVELDRRQRELEDARTQIEMARQQELRDRQKIDRDDKALQDREREATKLADDKGFQDSLQLYTTMPAKQVKTVFLSLPDDVVEKYLDAMPPKTATKIIKEFKLPEDVARIQKVLELMRQSSPSATPAAAPTDAPAPEASLKE